MVKWDSSYRYSQLEFDQHVIDGTCYELSSKGIRYQGATDDIVLSSLLWFFEGIVKVVVHPGVSGDVVETIIDATYERYVALSGMELTFYVTEATEHYRKQLDAALMDGGLHEGYLMREIMEDSTRNPCRDGTLHGVIHITSHCFFQDSVSWGASNPSVGAVVYALGGKNCAADTSFLRKVALHETNHLAGIMEHCDCVPNVRGFKYSPSCNHHYSCPSDWICEKCDRYALLYWRQITHVADTFYSRLRALG